MSDKWAEFMDMEDKIEAEETWLPMDQYKKDGTLVVLIAQGGDHPTEDADTFRTIGFNNLENDGEDKWVMAGWCWVHDHFTQAQGATPIKWQAMSEKG